MARLIDADALKELIANNVYPVQDAFNDRDYGMFWTGGIEKAIDNAPTVDPVKHGHWVEQEHEDWKWSKEYRCSECGQYRLVTTPVGREWNYCPSCGAKMDEVEDGKI